jgi:hypothetical protein
MAKDAKADAKPAAKEADKKDSKPAAGSKCGCGSKKK